MKTIDMNDFYVDPLLYGNPPQTEVSDEVAEALWQFMRDEQAADRRVRRAKAYYSLDCGDGIEYAAVFRMETPEEHYERKLTIKQLNTALAMLPIKQGQYIYRGTFWEKATPRSPVQKKSPAGRCGSLSAPVCGVWQKF